MWKIARSCCCTTRTRIRTLRCAPQPGSPRYVAPPNQDPHATFRAPAPTRIHRLGCAPQPGSARCIARPSQDPHATLRGPTRIQTSKHVNAAHHGGTPRNGPQRRSRQTHLTPTQASPNAEPATRSRETDATNTQS